MSLCDIPVVDSVCQFVGEGVARVVTAPFDLMAQGLATGASWLFQMVWLAIDSTTLVDVTTDGFVGVYNIMFGIGILIALVFFFLQLGTGLIRKDPSALKFALLGLARSILGGFLVITLTATALEIVDRLSIGIVQASGQSMATLGDKIALMGVAGVTMPGVSVILSIILGFLTIAAIMILWFSLLIRKALLLIAVVVAPLALSGTVWEHTKGWASKWLSFVVALAVSKLIIVVIFLVASAQMAAPIELDIAAVSDPISGMVLMLVAGFAPYMVYKVVSFMGFDVYQTMSMEQEAKQAANRPFPVPFRPGGDQASKVLGGKGGGEKSGAAAPRTSVSSSSGTAGAGAATGGASGGTAGASAGAGAGTGAGAGAGAGVGAGAAAGPAAGVVIGAQVAGEVIKAGPKIGNAVGGQVAGHAGASQASQPPPSSPPPTITPKGGA